MHGVIFLPEGDQIAVDGDVNQVSDGCHTFGELYEHRCILFIALIRSHPEKSWRSFKHSDGSFYEGQFICGIRTPKGDISYHCPNEMWDLLYNIETREKAPEWDGHTSADVYNRLHDWIFNGVW
jgi:hypothetical protein